jgi:hypothetical protein
MPDDARNQTKKVFAVPEIEELPDDVMERFKQEYPELAEQLDNAVGGFVQHYSESGEGERERLIEGLVNALSDHHKRCLDSIGSPIRHSVNAQNGWKAMTRIEKLKWIFCNVLFKWVGQYIRSIHLDHSTASYERERILDREFQDWVNEMNHPVPNLPKWASASPKMDLIVDVNLRLLSPITKLTARWKARKNRDSKS